MSGTASIKDVDEHKEGKRRENNEVNILTKSKQKTSDNTHAHKRPSRSRSDYGHTPEKRENVGINIVNANDKCKSCEEFLNDSNLLFYQGHPQYAKKEKLALTDDKLVLTEGDNDVSIIVRSHTNITGFSIYDKEGHLCAIDSGLIEKHVRLYASGYLKSICCDNPDIDDNCVPVKDVGPITKWFIHGSDGSEKYCIILSTKSGEYNLLKPSDNYKPVISNLYEKICISKVVVEYLEQNYHLQPSYEDLLEVIGAVTIPELENIKLTEDMLHKHAQFIYHQVESLETEDDVEKFITLPCISRLTRVTGIKLMKNIPIIEYKKIDNSKLTTSDNTQPQKRPSTSSTGYGHTSKKRENVGINIVNANDKCKSCEEFLNDSNLLFYQAHPQYAQEESIALTDDKLVLSTGDDNDVSIIERSQTNITGFSIYDKEGHLCAIDSGLIENHVRLYASGYLKSMCCDNPDIDENCVPVKDVGPITEWVIHGCDGGEKSCITLSTKFGEYKLLKPSEDYRPVMRNLYEKICISKVVVEYLEQNHHLQPSYGDLLEVIGAVTIPELENIKLTEDMLHKHAQFICDQVEHAETKEDVEPLITLPCVSRLRRLMGINLLKNRPRTIIRRLQDYKKINKKARTKATTIPCIYLF